MARISASFHEETRCVATAQRPAKLLASVRGHLADYMAPERIHIIDEMPHKGAGKTDRDRFRLRAEIEMHDL